MFGNVKIPTWNGELPRQDALETLRADLVTWISSPPLASLASSWEPKGAPPKADPYSLFRWFDNFSARHWDFRAGAERNLASVAELGADLEAVVLNAATALGLRDARPPQARAYDATLILGGLVRACVVRPRYAAVLAATGLETGKIIALGGFRPLAGDELELAQILNVSANDEFGAMVEGIALAFELSEPVQYEGTGIDVRDSRSWCIAHFESRSDVSVIAAPSSDPTARRANTVDTYSWWAERNAPLEGLRILLITSTIYVPYQGAGAIQALALRYGAQVETVGVPEDVADLGALAQVFSPSNYLQEIRSSIRGYETLYHAVMSELSDASN